MLFNMKNKIQNMNKSLKILFFFSQNVPTKLNKVFFPSSMYFIEDLENNKNIRNKRIIDILNANNLYYNLYKKSIKEKDIMEICDYINKYYPYHEIHKKALLVAIYRLSLINSFESVDKLQNILYDYYGDFQDNDLSFGSFLLLCEKVLHFNNNIQNNINIILDIQNSSHYIFSSNKKEINLVNYIIYYFLCEYYLVHAIEAFNANKYINSIMYIKKILVRANSHPKCALEALLLIIEIFCILNSQLLVEKYIDLLEEIYLLNKNENFLNTYYLRGLYIINKYGYIKNKI